MPKEPYRKESKYLSLVLRHKPEKIGISLDKEGWANVDELLTGLKRWRYAFNIETLKDIVATNNKRRFELNETNSKIRARQGHSVEVDLGYVETEPPEHLYHGTASHKLDLIYKDGLKKMGRHAVHLSIDDKTAFMVGKRHGNAVGLVVDAKVMHNDGHKFYLTGNDVWFTESVPAKYITKKVFFKDPAK